jgi:cell wall assembly regulator SMI1
MEWTDYLWDEAHPATDADIAAAERALGVTFPQALRDALREHQGQVPDPGLFDFDEGGERTTSVMGPLFHVREAAAGDPAYQLVHVARSRKHLLPDGVVPFSEDPSGNMIALDYRASKSTPPVVFLNHEEAGAGAGVTTLASSFEAFLAMLHEDTGDDSS